MKRRGPALVIPADGSEAGLDLPVPVLVHLSGPRRGSSQRLEGERLRLGARPDLEVQVSAEPSVAPLHATLRRDGASYLLAAEAGCPVWVNGEPVRERLLVSGDVLEIGRDGPILRFRLYPPGTRATKGVIEAFSDGLDGARFGGGSPSARAVRGVVGAVRELATQTTWLFRLAVIVVVSALVVSTGALLVRSRSLERRLAREELRVEGLAALLHESDRLLDSRGLESMRRRIEALEARSGAPERIVAAAARSVLLLQGAYGFVAPDGGEPLRFLGIGPDGLPLRNPGGEPIVGIGAPGPPVEVQFLGTAFVACSDGLLLTNRHMALPWDYDRAAQLVISQGLEPRMSRLIAYLPEVSEPVRTTLVGVASADDVALLWAPNLAGRVASLELRLVPPAAGEEVLVLGYPAGLQALLARSDEAFVADLLRESGVDFWEVARRLAVAGQIGPLASRGIVAQVSAAAVVYDAETTRGGSGGPVLDLEGRVLAINSAVLSEFGGSNIGVPAGRGRDLVLHAGFVRLPAWWPR